MAMGRKVTCLFCCNAPLLDVKFILIQICGGKEMFEKHYKSTKSISDIVHQTNKQNAGDVKRTNLYMDWIEKKSTYFTVEQNPLQIPDSIIPAQIDQFTFSKSKQDVQSVISGCYLHASNGVDYVKNSSVMFSNGDKEILLKNIVFKRGSVVWVDFGFNIGCEFGGKHPAIILKNLGEALIVAPLSSNIPQTPRRADVIINNVYGLPPRTRSTSVTRITPISIYRVDLNSPVGSVSSSDMRNISSAMKAEWNL